MRLLTALTIAVVMAGAGLSAQKAPGTPRGQGEKSPMSGLAFDGNPSTLVACVGGKFYNSHPLGFATTGTKIRVDVISGEAIDPTAALVVLQMGGHHPEGNARASFSYDDDSGGNRDPRIDFTLPYDGFVTLNVGSYDGTFGCYWVKVSVTPN